MSFLVRVLINGVAIWLATVILDGFEVVGADETWQRVGIYLLVGALFGVVNAVVKPLVQLLSLPLYILTLGLFTLVVNALMLMLTAWLTEFTAWGIRIDDFGTAVLAGLIIAIVSFVLSVLVPDKD